MHRKKHIRQLLRSLGDMGIHAQIVPERSKEHVILRVEQHTISVAEHTVANAIKDIRRLVERAS